MADRTSLVSSEPRVRRSALERMLGLSAALAMIVAMVAVAKIAQFASVEAFGGRLGFDGASLLGVAPVIAFYFFLSVRYPHLNKLGLARG